MFLSDNGDFPIWKWGIFLPILRIFYWQNTHETYVTGLRVCQCPLGLILHFYPAYVNQKLAEVKVSVNALSGLYLISTMSGMSILTSVSGVSMPSRAYTSFLHSKRFFANEDAYRVSMPSRAYTSFLQYPFKNLGFMRFPEPVFAGIYQNILTAAVFRAC